MNNWAKIKPDKIPTSTEIDNDFWGYFKKGDKILDVGCGIGKNIMNCLSKGLEVTGIDINKEAIKIAKNNQDLSSAEIFAEDILNSKFKGFNGVLLQGVLCTMTEKERVRCLKKVKEALIKGGILHVAEFESNDDNIERYKKDFELTKEWGTLSIKDVLDGEEICPSHQFSEKEIGNLLKDFKILSFKRKIFISYHGNKIPGIIIIAQKYKNGK